MGGGKEGNKIEGRGWWRLGGRVRAKERAKEREQEREQERELIGLEIIIYKHYFFFEGRCAKSEPREK